MRQVHDLLPAWVSRDAAQFNVLTLLQRDHVATTGTQQAPKCFIIFNLFALEGFHVAEALGLPCMALSPCLVPYTPPASFARRLKKTSPALHQALQDSATGIPFAQYNVRCPIDLAVSLGTQVVSSSWFWPYLGLSVCREQLLATQAFL